MTPVMALTALTTLISGVPFHGTFHARALYLFILLLCVTTVRELYPLPAGVDVPRIGDHAIYKNP